MSWTVTPGKRTTWSRSRASRVADAVESDSARCNWPEDGGAGRVGSRRPARSIKYPDPNPVTAPVSTLIHSGGFCNGSLIEVEVARDSGIRKARHHSTV